jgi:hypothetical protein
MGLALAARGEGDPAAALRRAIAIKPEALEARAALVDVLTAAGQDASADIKAARPYGGIGKGYLLLAIQELEAGREAEARSHASKAVDSDAAPLASALIWLIGMKAGKGDCPAPVLEDTPEARQLAALATRAANARIKDDDDTAVAYLIGFSLAICPTVDNLLLSATLNQRRLLLPNAWEALLSAERLDPGNPVIYRSMQRTALARGDVAAALAAHARIPETADRTEVDILNDAQLMLAAGQAEQVLDLCRGHWQSSLQPAFRSSLCALALLRLNRSQEAEAELTEAETWHQGRASCLIDIAIAYAILGRPEKALAFWEQAIRARRATMTPFLLRIRRWAGPDIMALFGVAPEEG